MTHKRIFHARVIRQSGRAVSPKPPSSGRHGEATPPINEGLHLAAPGQEEKLLGEGLQPQVAFARDGMHVVWQDHGTILHLAPGAIKPFEIGAGAYASMATAPDGQSAIVAWEAEGGVAAAVLGK